MARATSTRIWRYWKISSLRSCPRCRTCEPSDAPVGDRKVDHPALAVLVLLPARVDPLAVLADRADHALRERGMIAPDPPLAATQRHAVEAVDAARVEVMHREALAVLADGRDRAGEWIW